MKVVSRALPALILAAVAAPAFAQPVKERAGIVSTNWAAMEVQLKDPKGRLSTWKVRRDAVVIFEDKKEFFPNPKLADLRAPMYVYFSYDDATKVIDRFEVREVGYDPAQGGPGVRQEGVITNLDVNVGHIVVKLPTGESVFEVDPKGQLRSFKVGDRVSILIETREGGREVVTQVDRK